MTNVGECPECRTGWCHGHNCDGPLCFCDIETGPAPNYGMDGLALGWSQNQYLDRISRELAKLNRILLYEVTRRD